MARFVLLIALCTAITSPVHPRSPEHVESSKSLPVAASAMSNSNEMSIPVLPPGMHEQTIRSPDGTVLRFTISVPEGYANTARYPLVVVLHYGGEVTPFYGRGILEGLIAPALKELDAVIVAPDSIAGRWTNETNEVAVLHIVDRIVASYSIDTRKLLATGYSMGGQGAWYIAGRHQNRFSAAIPMAGRPFEGSTWRIPVYVIHSRDDEVIPFAPTRRFVERLQSEGRDVQMVVLDGITHYQTLRFVEPLRDAIPWIRRVWNASPSALPSGN